MMKSRETLVQNVKENKRLICKAVLQVTSPNSLKLSRLLFL